MMWSSTVMGVPVLLRYRALLRSTDPKRKIQSRRRCLHAVFMSKQERCHLVLLLNMLSSQHQFMLQFVHQPLACRARQLFQR